MENNSATKFLHLSPVLASSNVPRDIEWYESKLGFKNVYDSSAYSEGKIDYVVLGRGGLFFHLQFQFPDDMTSTDLKFQVQNIAPLFEELAAHGLIPPGKITRKTSWNTSEVSLFDPSGNRITFFEDV
ncbi:MAG: VOC family protein [Saprospiraceae bacterium]